jgi:hypothetical protein
LTTQQKLWACYCVEYELVLWGIGYGMSARQIRTGKALAERIGRITECLEARDPHEAEAYASITGRAQDDALAGRPPNLGPFGFGSDWGPLTSTSRR